MHVYLHPIKRRNYLVTGDENSKKKKSLRRTTKGKEEDGVHTFANFFSARASRKYFELFPRNEPLFSLGWKNPETGLYKRVEKN